MEFFQLRLFFRILAKSKEVYLLKIITLAVAFASSSLLLLFSLHEFGYDRFHRDPDSIFRLLQRNNTESFIGNRFSNKIPLDVYNDLQSISADSLLTARVKLLDKVNVLVEGRLFKDSKVYAADARLCDIFSFEVVSGSVHAFKEKENTMMLSSSEAFTYFKTREAAGKKLQLYTLGDTLLFTVAAVYKDYPQNSHKAFQRFIHYDSATLQSLHFNPREAGVYGKMLLADPPSVERLLRNQHAADVTYSIQPLSEIYFGPRVAGEDARHGDHYSILILLCIAALILFLSLSSFINLTTLTLPYRSKELAIKKLAGTSQTELVLAFAKESVLVVGIGLLLAISLVALLSSWIKSLLSLDLVSMLSQGDVSLVLILIALFLVIAIAPLFMTLRFTRATPSRLLSTDTITFPRFKRTIIFFQLGISIFLIVASMVIKRQINYSLLKEPGRNYDQVVYVPYPKNLTNEGLASMRVAWKKINANVVDLMATSQLPDRISSKELDSEFYSLSVDRGFKDFFELEMVQGTWFRPNDGDSILVVNELGKTLLGTTTTNTIGVFNDLSGQFNQPEKPVKMNVSSYFQYNYLCIRILEVDIRRTVHFLERHFQEDGQKATVSFLDRRFEEWLRYQDRLNTLSELLAILSGILSCLAIYGLSIGIVRDKLKPIAIHKLCGASSYRIIRLLMMEFAQQMLWAILIFGPLTYLVLHEVLRNFVFTTPFTWFDPLVPLAYCLGIITLLCGFQTLSLNREDLSSALKG